MHRLFIKSYIIIILLLLLATPFDLTISTFLHHDLGEFFRAVSELVYIPPFFIGYFGIFYYLIRLLHREIPQWMRFMLYSLGLFGIYIVSTMFYRSMRFFPFYQVFAPVFIVLLVIAAYRFASHVYKERIKAFDYLASIGLALIVTLYYLVTQMKRLFGRARPYVVFEDESLFTPWYSIEGPVFIRDFYSIPSGHITFVTIAFWFVVVCIHVKPYIDLRVKMPLLIFLWIIFQSYMRILLGEHYLTDVIFSVLLSLLLLHLITVISQIIMPKIFSFIDQKYKEKKRMPHEH